MGFGIPAAIGAKLAHRDKDVVCVCGDGGFLISSFELLTAKREKLNIKVFVFNDGNLGLIKHSQLKAYGRDNSVNLTTFDFRRFAESVGVEYIPIHNDSQINEQFEKTFTCEEPVIVDVNINYSEEPRYFQGTAKTFWDNLSKEEKIKISQRILNRRKR